MKKILGLDLGTNSIGWALVETDENSKPIRINAMGSRIIPMSQDILGNFDAGNSISQTAERTGFRGTRRLRERHLLRRERLHRMLNVLGFLPEHYAKQIDFEKRLGQFSGEVEPKIARNEIWNEQKNKNDYEFIFQKSFDEMLEDFRKSQPDLLRNNKKIPYDWTIYYLRKKALTEKIKKEELAWIILNFNQKRGYYQLRGEDDEDATKTAKTRKYFDRQTIRSIIDTNETYKGLKVLVVELDNGNKGKIFKKEIPQWIGLEKSIIATVDIKDGKDRYEENGLLSQRFSIPTDAEWETEWKLVKLKTEKDLQDSDKTVGTYIYETLLQNPSQKIRGKLVRTIERKFYKTELEQILKKQIELQPELFTENFYNGCIRELYRNNEAQQLALSKRDFVHLFINDIIFYQRPLKSQKSSIGNCSLEYRKYKEKDGNEVTEYLKTIPKSNPLYQEFRVWQWLYNLKIYTKTDDNDVTAAFLKSIEDWENLFAFLMTKKEVNLTDILNYLIAPAIKEKYPDAKPKVLKSEITKETSKYRWNYVFDDSKEKEDEKSKTYPMNETGYEIRKRLDKVENFSADFLTPEIEQKLWHIIHSVTDKNEFEKALKTFAEKHGLDVVSFIENFKKFPPFKSEYGSFSEKAIKKLLPLMRLGKYWSWEAIDAKTKDRISKILNGEFDETIKNSIREKAINLTNEHDFQGLQLWLAQYIVYDRHSEANIAGKWNSIADLENYIEKFKQHSLRNPIVEQVIMETLRVVRDIWKKYGNPSEIHIELGREMKNTADDRKKITNQITENENTNLRIKLLLAELKNNSDGKLAVDDVRENSPTQQEILKIYEDGVLNSDIVIDEDILKISKTAQPSKSELQRYKLWLEQKYCSPYTGEIIPLSKLFTTAYQIEHIIPQSRYFDNSLSNKVICESEVNKKKDNQLGLEFIKNHYGEKIQIGEKHVTILTEEAYKKFVEEHYSKNKAKHTKLLLEEIPDKMIARQLNDTRYISKFVLQILSNIVREDKDDDGVNSKKIIPSNGKITDRLKQDWGLNNVWNSLILLRFERMNELTQTKNFTSKNQEGHTIPAIPLELSKGFQKKRIDHRHHAMDALVIACATRDHVNLLNNQSAKSDNSRFDLQYKLRNTEKWKDNDGKERDKFTEFKKPWDNFTTDARNELEKIVVSFKQNLRVINKATNKYTKIKDSKKVEVKQEGTNWAIRKSLHKDTVFGKISLRKIKSIRLNEALKNWQTIVNKELKEEIKQLIIAYGGEYKIDIITKHFKDKKYIFNDTDISKVDVYYFETENAATRKPLNTSFNAKVIESITDTGIQKILLKHLGNKGNNPELAFSPEGIEEMNKNITELNGGKKHQPVYKIRVYEPVGNKFPIGNIGNKKNKYVEAAKGTNLFFAVYADENGNRSYETIPLNIVIERLKQGLKEIPETNEKRHNLLFSLSPNDLVYVPTAEERNNNAHIDMDNINPNRIYKMVSSSGNQCFFVQQLVANSIVNKVEFSALNKMERAITGEMIKDIGVKIEIDRLGNIIKKGSKI